MKNRPWIFEPWARVVIVLVVLIVVGGAATGIVLSQSTPDQPIDFPHNFHVGSGIQCQYCHPGVDWGATAGLPTTDKCWGCHQQISTEGKPRLQKLAQYAQNNEQIPWVPVFIQPDFVHFNHNGHINARIACETCHGDVAKGTVAQPIPQQNMGWCLDCHQKMAPEQWERLSDCSLCHY